MSAFASGHGPVRWRPRLPGGCSSVHGRSGSRPAAGSAVEVPAASAGRAPSAAIAAVGEAGLAFERMLARLSRIVPDDVLPDEPRVAVPRPLLGVHPFVPQQPGEAGRAGPGRA